MRNSEFLARLTGRLLKSESETYFVRRNNGTLGTSKTHGCPTALVRRKRDALRLHSELSDFSVKLFEFDFEAEVLFYFTSTSLANLLTVELPRIWYRSSGCLQVEIDYKAVHGLAPSVFGLECNSFQSLSHLTRE